MHNLFQTLAVFCFLNICDVLTLPPHKPYEIVYNGSTGMMTYSFQAPSLSMYCNKQDKQLIRMTDAFPPSNVTLSFTGVHIKQCLPINTSYIEEFKALNINTTILDGLTLVFDLDKPLSPGNYTEGLAIQHLSLVNENYPQVFQNTPNFFEPLSDLTSIYVSGIEIPPLPETMRLVNLSLTEGASITDWGACGYLERLDLSDFDKENFPVWPQNCTRLEHLEIGYLLPDTALIVAERMIAAAPSLRTLKITYCRLNNLPIEMIRASKNLVYLDLSDNKLYDDVFTLFPFHDSLRTLDLSSNLFQGYGLASLASKLPTLVELFLKWEDDFDCTINNSELIGTLQNSSIETLDFGPTAIYLDCMKDIRFSNLKYLSVVSPEENQLELLQLPQTNAEHLEVDFGYNIFDEILFDEADYETLQKENSTSPYNGRNLTVMLRYIPCDCQHGWLARALRDFPHIISMPTVKCDEEYGIPILEEPVEHLECTKIEHDGCLYRESWRDGTFTAECDEESWREMNTMYPLHGLNVSGQGIVNLHTKLPDTLQWLDLRRNSISRASAEEAAALFAAGRRVWLADNLLLCDCNNSALLDAIQLHKEMVQDYNLLKCVGTGEPIRTISTAGLCQVAFVASLSMVGVLVVVAGLIAGLLRRYGEQLRMFLYSRGWCVSCLHRQDVDDKPYDVFISFAHEDREYVMETLLPGLENAPEKFRVCVHYRDWLVGDWIPAQIMRSVQLSKRTLILLSRNFVASAWSTLELRYSLANAEEDTSAKVLVLIKDDVLDMDLDIAFRRYLALNTYLRCDDPWFWEKLRYAMPHKVQNKTTKTEDYEGVRTVRGKEVNMAIPNVAIGFTDSTNFVKKHNALQAV